MDNESLFTTLARAYIPDDHTTNYFTIHDGTVRVWQDHKYKAIVELAPPKLSTRVIPFMTYEQDELTKNKFHPLNIYRDTKQFEQLNTSVGEFHKLILAIPSPDGLWLIKFAGLRARIGATAHGVS